MSLGTFEEDFPEIANKPKEILMPADYNELNKNFKPEEVNDDSGFKPIKGAYICRIDRAEHKKGTAKTSGEPYDFYALKLQVTEVIEGDKGLNRFLDRVYRNDNDGIKKLLNDMFTSGIELDRSSEEALDASLSTLKDKTVKVRTWIWTPDKNRDGSPIPEEERTGRQQLKIIKEFKLGQAGKSNETAKDNEVPF